MNWLTPHSARLIWGVATALSVATFGIVEGTAIRKHMINETLSWQVWMAERKYPLLRWAILFFLVWLAGHFFND